MVDKDSIKKLSGMREIDTSAEYMWQRGSTIIRAAAETWEEKSSHSGRCTFNGVLLSRIIYIFYGMDFFE